MYRDVANELAEDLHFPTGRPLAEALGYPADLLALLPAEAVNSFAGLGYHLGLARLLPGERVLDLGSGSGMDVFAAATQVGPTGSVTGVDITPEQLAKSERLRRAENTHFRRVLIEELPFDDDSFDAVISNGVANLVADKPRVLAEAARGTSPRRTVRAGRHRDSATDRRSYRVPGGPLGGPTRRGQPARSLPEGHHRRRPRAAVGPGQPEPPFRDGTRAAHQPQVRRAQRGAARDQDSPRLPQHHDDQEVSP